MKELSAHRPRVGILGIDRSFDTAVGISPHVACRRQWIDRIAAAGCLPVVIPAHVPDPTEFLDMVEALVLPGGGDVDPSLYGAEPHLMTGPVDSQRDRWELEVLNAALAEDFPILSICRGMQLLNVALGGTLNQHIASEPDGPLEHFRADRWDLPVHRVRVEPISWLARALGSETCSAQEFDVKVNSLHHQAVSLLGQGLIVTGVSEDGVVESVESGRHTFVVGVQWHPELMHDPAQALGLFGALAEALRDKSMGARKGA